MFPLDLPDKPGAGGHSTTTQADGSEVNSDPRLELVADGLVRVQDACEFLGIGKSLLYELMGEGQITFVKIRGRRCIPRRALAEFAAKNLVEGRAE